MQSGSQLWGDYLVPAAYLSVLPSPEPSPPPSSSSLLEEVEEDFEPPLPYVRKVGGVCVGGGGGVGGRVCVVGWRGEGVEWRGSVCVCVIEYMYVVVVCVTEYIMCECVL